MYTNNSKSEVISKNENEIFVNNNKPITKEMKIDHSDSNSRSQGSPDSDSPVLRRSKRVKRNIPIYKSENDNIDRDEIKKCRYHSPKKNERKNLYLSPSAKLDYKVPKVEDILRRRKEDEEFKKTQEIIDKMSERFIAGLKDKKPIVEEKKEAFQLMDCKHLSLQELEKKFKNDLKFIDDIFYGRRYSERHELFKEDTPLNNFTTKDLRINESFGVFTSDQITHIVSLFRDRYDNGNRYKYSDYYFKVLLPEYCTHIFMECYNMKCDEAMDYLSRVPVPDHFKI